MNSMPAFKIKPQSEEKELRSVKGKGAKVISISESKKALRKGLLNPEERDALVLEYRMKARTLAHSILRKWHARLDMQEVESVVDLSLCEAVRRFNRHKGASFMTFLFYHLRGNLIRAVSAAASLNYVPLPEQELAEMSGDSSGAVNAIEIAETLCHHDFVSPDDALMKKELSQISNHACAKLDPLEQEVIYRIYIGEQQLMDVARTLGYSRCHISRVKKKALETLFKEMAPSMVVDGKMPQPNFECEDEVSGGDRRIVHRRRPRAHTPAVKIKSEGIAWACNDR